MLYVLIDETVNAEYFTSQRYVTHYRAIKYSNAPHIVLCM